MKSCSAMRQLSKIIIMFCMLLLPHTTDTRFQMSTQDQNVITSLNSDVLLPCIFRTQGDFVDTEFIIVTWTHNNKEIARYKAGDVLITSKALLFESELQKGNASLLLSNFQVGDKGEYICHVVDAPDEGQIRVRLEDLLKMRIIPDTLVKGKEQIISCLIDGHYTEEINIIWKKNGVPLRKTKTKDNSTFITAESLILTPVDEEDEFKCEVKLKGLNEIISATKKFKLTELPKVMIVPDILVRGKDQIISCIIDGHFPEDISITWKKNGVPLRKTKTKDDGTFITTESLMLNPVDENDEFTCEVQVMNEIISTTKKFKLTGNSLSLAGIGNIVLSIILILILMIALYIWYHREKLCMKAKPPIMQIEGGRWSVPEAECIQVM
uniref:Ig-like domain-containing protein n=1 Tax=Erpetoichthys calabaricus TaxID=27687 RepID=A0A8C4TBQ4_ERPCA